MTSVKDALAKFRDSAIRAGNLSQSKAQNKAARELQQYYKLLCGTEEGKIGIIALMADPDPGVRLSAAARALQWVPEQARAVLEDLRRDAVFPVSFEAEITLEEFDKGHLSFDY